MTSEVDLLKAEIDRLANRLHELRAHPDYEYRTTTCARKEYCGEPELEKDGWEQNQYGSTPEDRCHSDWERFEYHEEHYWRRRRADPTRAKGD